MKKLSIAIIAVLFSLLIKLDSYAAPAAQEKIFYIKDNSVTDKTTFKYEKLFNSLPEEADKLFVDENFKKKFVDVCEKYKIDVELMIALIETESTYNPEAKNYNGTCIGPCQVSIKWHSDRAEELGVELTDTMGNIITGLDYLAELSEDNTMEYALMVYNMGYEKANNYRIAGKVSSYANNILSRAEELKKYKEDSLSEFAPAITLQ